MSRAALERFLASTKIGYMEWHDGIGYDLDALAQLDGSERAEVEDFLVPRACTDWSDVEALVTVGSERALRAVERALSAKDYVVRCHAIQQLLALERLDQAAAMEHVAQMLPHTTILNGMTHVLMLAKRFARDDRIKKQLLRCAARGNDDVRVHAAALVHHLWGPASSDFDWAHRPFYLRFGRNKAERRAAFERLCAQIGVDPAWIDS